MSLLLNRSLAPDTQAAFGANWEQMATARSLAAGQGFANPFRYATGPTAVLAPVHPLMLASILFLWGDRPTSAIPMLILEGSIQVACVALMLRISIVAFSAWIPGAIAAGAALLCTLPLPQWESSMAWLAFEAAFLCALLGVRTGWTGMIVGLGWLVSPALIPASLAAIWLIRGRKYLTFVAGIALLVVIPWSARNWMIFRSPVLVRDGFGLELFLSNNDLAGPRFEDAEAVRYERWHPGTNPAVAAELRRVGEPEYFSRLQWEALRWIRRHSVRFFQLVVARIWLWWASTWLVAVLSLLGFVGLWMNRRTSMGKAAAAAFLLFPLPYYVIQFSPRYTYPVLWLAALMAGDACYRLKSFCRKGALALVAIHHVATVTSVT